MHIKISLIHKTKAQNIRGPRNNLSHFALFFFWFYILKERTSIKEFQFSQKQFLPSFPFLSGTRTVAVVK